MRIVGEAADGDEAVAVARRERPSVVVMDVRMPGRDGLSATAELVGALPDVRVLVLTTFDVDDYLYGALRAGASGFLLKNASPEDLIRAVEVVASGDSVLDPVATRRIMARFARPGPAGSRAGVVPDGRALAQLTEREKDVLALMTRGANNAETAELLGISETTTKTHVSRVLTKLGVRDRVQAVVYAYEVGFAPSDRAFG